MGLLSSRTAIPAKDSLETKKQNLSMCINYEYIVGLQQLKSR